jgi:spore coat polysaccharide biosynthesis protein SpsF
MERMKACRNAEKIVLCTTENPEDDILVDIALREGIAAFRGPNENVALRLMLASRKFGFDHIVRVTGDDLLRDIRLIDQAILSHLERNADYTCMTGVVYSCDTEIISTRALETIVERATRPENTEYLTWYLDDRSAFVCNVIQAPKEYDRPYRITLDTADDLKMFESVFNALYVPGQALDLLEVLDYLDTHPEAAQMNASSKPKLTRDQLDVSLRI